MIQNGKTNEIGKVSCCRMENCIVWVFMKKIHIIKLLCCLYLLVNSNFVFTEESKYTVKSSEERINYLVSLIEHNLGDSSLCLSFKEEQKAWELYKQKHLDLIFPDSIDNVKMLWGSIESTEMGKEILILNIERIKVLESYLTRNSEGTDGRGDYKMYVEELKRIQK